MMNDAEKSVGSLDGALNSLSNALGGAATIGALSGGILGAKNLGKRA